MSGIRPCRIPAVVRKGQPWAGFTYAQRRRLGLTGRLPSAVLTLDQQAERVYIRCRLGELQRPQPASRTAAFCHEVLYFKVLADHLPERCRWCTRRWRAIQRFSDEYRGQRGLFLSI